MRNSERILNKKLMDKLNWINLKVQNNILSIFKIDEVNYVPQVN